MRTSFLRVQVRLLEDGYICWLNLENIHSNISKEKFWEPVILNSLDIRLRLNDVLNWIQKAYLRKNKYLWGGTIGPDFDCSGLVQAAFASQSIWLPRDAYQQECFCVNLKFKADQFNILKPADLLFFGSKNKCDHVGIYRGNGLYWHSSGEENGRNGVGCDSLIDIDSNSISNYYRSRLRGAGRVDRCHDGSTLP